MSVLIWLHRSLKVINVLLFHARIKPPWPHHTHRWQCRKAYICLGSIQALYLEHTCLHPNTIADSNPRLFHPTGTVDVCPSEAYMGKKINPKTLSSNGAERTAYFVNHGHTLSLKHTYSLCYILCLKLHMVSVWNSNFDTAAAFVMQNHFIQNNQCKVLLQLVGYANVLLV